MFLGKFEVGKRYRFNKELLSEYRKLNGREIESAWEDDIHLDEVTIISDSDGYIGRYVIIPEWCEEITEGDGK